METKGLKDVLCTNYYMYIDTMVAMNSLICLRSFVNNVLLKHSTWIVTSGVSMFKHCQVIAG